MGMGLILEGIKMFWNIMVNSIVLMVVLPCVYVKKNTEYTLKG